MKSYLEKHAFRPQLIKDIPENNLSTIVVIPAHDEKSLLPTLESLQNCIPLTSCVEVMIVFNASEKDLAEVKRINERARSELTDWYKNLESPVFRLHTILENNLPVKHAGVGLARKIGMDEAVRRFEKVKDDEGIIVCFDADSKCEENYLQQIEAHFRQHKGACSIHFEHPLSGDEFSSEVYKGIYYYELHLRYYKNGLAYAGLPYAFHTIGSSMAVQAIDYCRQGGMNRRKAGEDFYFLQKFIDVGKLTELKTTTVVPSPRASHRVPFGTGRAIQEMLDDERQIEKSYDFNSFTILKNCFTNLEKWYTEEGAFHPLFVAYYGEDFLKEKVQSIRKQSTSKERFVNRFFQWFNAFQCLKFMHYLRDNGYPLKELDKEVRTLLQVEEIEKHEDLLKTLRELDAA